MKTMFVAHVKRSLARPLKRWHISCPQHRYPTAFSDLMRALLVVAK